MNRIKTLMTLVLTLFLAASLVSSVAFAASANKPPGDPPYGLHVEGAAKGTKLIGVLYVQLYDDPDQPVCVGFNSLNAYVRLRQGADSSTFATGTLVGCFSEANRDTTQNAILEALRDEVIDYYFCNGYGTDEPCYTSLDLVLKDVTDYGSILFDNKLNILMDIVFTAHEPEAAD